MKKKLGYFVLGVLSTSLIGIVVFLNGNFEKEIVLNGYANENFDYQLTTNEVKFKNNDRTEEVAEGEIIKEKNNINNEGILESDIVKEDNYSTIENNFSGDIKKEEIIDEPVIKENNVNIEVKDTPIIKEEKIQLKSINIPENNTVKLIDKSNGAFCAQAIEYFWQDANYRYYFSCIKSHNMYVLKNSQEYRLVDALKNKITTIEELENNGYRFLKESRDLQVK